MPADPLERHARRLERETQCEFEVDVWADDRCAYIRVAVYPRFDDAVAEFDRLTRPYPDMRVTMRHRAHVFREWVPARLRP